MTENLDSMFNKSVLVVAHPDDEILWFSSILNKVDAIIFCFLDYTPAPDLGSGRRKVISEYPLPNLSCLNITEAGSFNGADWDTPRESDYGLEITANKNAAERYQSNFHTLNERLTSVLKGYKNVYTHNPWGEYGHEDHVQVYRVIKSIRQQQGFDLWFSNYGSNRSVNLMLRYLSGHNSKYIGYPANINLATMIADLYMKYKCWTWYGDYEWFKEECFINDANVTANNKSHGHIFPINFIKTDFPENTAPVNKNKKTLIRKLIRRK